MPIGERTPRPEKVATVAELKELLSAGTVILTDFTGLDVKLMGRIRSKLRTTDSGYRVVKNTLFKLAAQDTPTQPLAETLVGATAIVYTDGDPVAAAKALQEFAKGPKAITVKSGVVDGHIMSAEQMIALAKMPSKPELYAMVVGGLQAPITNLVGTLQGMTTQLVMTLKAVAEQKSAA